ncbi:DNA repair protein [Phytophthora rubi]|uniref:DNA repair protein RAD50 n=1 Tax=Phytophthora rubi TaxID=129364 RepID=A0A6A3M5H0_9STRA|nr:DNA repair protein [Phytophthora rubi]KAE9039419.1 DNA repair protein [Phytophthora rubi]KAE9335638.1 DNA repair protein [Phytophthora rubi]
MSSIEKLSIRGIRSFSPNREEVVEFYHPLTVLLGDNGCGKTTVIECLKLACTGGLPPGARSGQSLVHDPKIAGTNEVKASVRLRFRNRAGQPMVVQRSFQVRQTKKSLTFKALDGVVRVLNELGEKVSLSHKCGELDQHIPDMLGVSKSILESVVFCHQEESNWPLKEGAELKKKFDNIFESARYTKALEAIRKLKKARLDDAKDHKRDLDVLSVGVRTAESIREKIELAQDKLRQAAEEAQRADERIAQAEVPLKELQQLKEEVRRLCDQLQRRQDDVQAKERSARSAYARIEKIMSDSDDELMGLLTNYDATIDEHRRAFDRLREKEMQLQTEQKKAKDEYVALRDAKARAETNIDMYQKMVADLIDLAAKLGTKYRFHLQPLSSQQDDVAAFVAEFRNVVKDKQEAVNSLDVKQRQEDDKLTTELSELTSQVKHLRDELNAKTRSLETLNQEKRVVANRLRELGGAGLHCQREAEEMSTQVSEAEKTLEDYKQKNDVMALKNEIQGFNRQINDINNVIDELGQQISQLRLYAHKNSELEFKRSDYLKKKEAFQITLGEKVADFEEILEGGEKPKDRDSLASAVGRIDTLIVERKRSCDTKKIELAAAEKRLMENTTSSKLAEKELDSLRQKKNELERQHMTGLKSLLDKVIPGEDLRNAELGVKEAEQAYADAKDKVVRRKNMVMFLNIYKKKGIKDHCCPLCERDMTPEEEQAFESILSDKTDDGKVADKIKKAEDLEKSTLETLTGIKQKMPSWRKWLELETTVPQKVNELEEIYAAQKALENDVLDKKTTLELIQEKFEDAKVAKTELDMLRKTADELHASDAIITREEERMKSSQGMGGRSLSDVEAEKDAKQAELQELNRQVQRKQRELDHINEMLQQLQNDLHNQREEKLRMETQRKEYDDAVKEQNRLREQEKVLKDACSKLKKSEPELEREAHSKTTEREAHRDAARKQMRAQRTELQERQGDFRVFSDKCKQVQRGELEKLEREVQTLSDNIAHTKQREDTANQSLADLASKMKSVENNLSENEIVKRHIQDNLDYRALQKELEEMRAEVEDLTAHVGNLPTLDDVNDRIESASTELIAAKESRAVVTGKKQQLMAQIRENKVELRVPNLKDVEEKYRHKLIQFETTQMAVADLDRYFKALDESLLQYHSKKVEEINTIIRSLWQITYKGQDIDTIELVSGQDQGVAAKAARSYDYRVVMKKAGATIDMRGRCSAGQKVLAALVIRLALAETFCLNCGILALDEPTTNLDTENKFGLAQAITDILSARSQQQNFQLVCITHDEEFVQMLSRTQTLDGTRPEYYWRISREDIGGNRFVSKIERHEWEDGI